MGPTREGGPVREVTDPQAKVLTPCAIRSTDPTIWMMEQLLTGSVACKLCAPRPLCSVGERVVDPRCPVAMTQDGGPYGFLAGLVGHASLGLYAQWRGWRGTSGLKSLTTTAAPLLLCHLAPVLSLSRLRTIKGRQIIGLGQGSLPPKRQAPGTHLRLGALRSGFIESTWQGLMRECFQKRKKKGGEGAEKCGEQGHWCWGVTPCWGPVVMRTPSGVAGVVPSSSACQAGLPHRPRHRPV
ncbi:hypothetical protein NDU88_003229 [Pleurodeles waltl]|uniref:Uncharacterized protein n=1 Tax=Pleurodeles waltl TaxID=8319 RepID=A0AAV7LEP1_PLEWA|nr:hypothetical protein NDU88_003229 [Pleurodeles waltl]